MRQFWHAQRTRIRHIQAELWRSELMQSAKQLVARDTKRCGCGVWFVLKNGRGKNNQTKRAKTNKQTNKQTTVPVGSLGNGNTQENFDASPVYWIYAKKNAHVEERREETDRKNAETQKK